MKEFPYPKLIALLLLASSLLSQRLEAQIMGVGVTTSASSIPSHGTLTFFISVSNLISQPPLFNVSITNQFTSTFPTPTITNSLSATSTNLISPNSVVINIPQLNNGFPALIALSIQPTTTGLLTNFISIGSSGSSNQFVTLVTAVTNAPSAVADLVVSIQGPAFPVLVNDFMTYGVTVTNLGPSAATNVFLTNTLPSGVVFRGTNQSLVTLGTLTNGAVRTFTVSVEPTNSGSFTFSAAVGGGGVADTNTANNVATTNITVEALVRNVLVATNLTPMVFNPQNSVMEQTIRLVNVSETNDAASARVIVTGLASTNWLRNAVGTNNGNPYVIYAQPLAPGESVDLLLQYLIKNRLPITVDNSNYLAVPTAAVNLIAPTNFSLSITNIAVLPSQAVLIEFPATQGRTYTILYSTNFSDTTLAAQPSIVAQADKVQWIDDGPPKTISHPTNAPARFYRVLLNP